jgi:cytosine/adenosine deaminase-related metal-dependent hydrolase
MLSRGTRPQRITFTVAGSTLPLPTTASSLIGRDYSDPVDRVIDGADRFVLPGLFDIHSHPEHQPLYRGVRKGSMACATCT